MKAYLDIDRIRVEFDDMPEEQGYAYAKTVSASRKVRGAHGVAAVHYPLSVDKCMEMRDKWGAALQVEKALGAWYRQAAARRAEQVAKAAQTDAELTVLPALYPNLAKWLKADQRVTAAWVADAYRGGGLLADEVGTGKTVGVLAGLIEAKCTGPTLIVCPKISVKAVWAKELHDHLPDVPVYLGRGTRPAREKALAAFMADPHPFKVLVIVAEMLRIKAIREGGRVREFLGYEYPALYEVEWATVVVDESQKLLGSSDTVKANLAGEGLKALSYAKDRRKLAVSATPFGKGGKVQNIFGTLQWIWPDEFPGKWAWLEKHFHVNEDRVFIKGGRGQTKLVKRVGGIKDEEGFWRELGPRVLRRTMEEVSPDHRDRKSWVEVPCEMDPRQAKQYAYFAENAELPVDGGVISSVGVLDFMTRARQLANGVLRKEGGRVVYTRESCKLDRMLQLLERHPDRKVVITSQYNEFLDAVEDRLEEEGHSWYRLDGSTSDREREWAMNEFQSGQYDTRLFLLNSQAGGVSITLDAADVMVQLDEMYPPEANTQLYGRIFRRGRVHNVIYYMLRAMGTIDEKIGFNVGEGHAQQLKVLDGRRGLEYVRQLAKYTEQ